MIHLFNLTSGNHSLALIVPCCILILFFENLRAFLSLQISWRNGMEIGKPPFVPVQDVEMGFEKIVKIAHSRGGNNHF